MTYDEALAFWYGRINYEVRAAKPGDLKLECMQSLLHRLGDPHEKLRLVHITGTKGKGSTAAMVAAILQAAGYRVGLFTSPHLSHVEERIQINGESISRCDLTARMADVAAVLDDPAITFFEIGTALGFLHFAHSCCDVAVIEVGLGGRFDSTNVCTPLVSVITNIGYDHMAQLGNSLEAIAFEKAGIIKRGVPVVSGVMQAAPREVVERIAREQNAALYSAGEIPLDPSMKIGLLGGHQRENAACAVAAILRLREAGMAIPEAAVREGLATVRWPARIELISRDPIVILDTAHNVPSTEALVKTLSESFPQVNHRSVILAVSSDKQYPEMLRALATYFARFYFTKYGTNPRSVPPEKLADILQTVDRWKPISLHSTSDAAFHAARRTERDNGLICITGSVFLAGELRPLLRS